MCGSQSAAVAGLIAVVVSATATARPYVCEGFVPGVSGAATGFIHMEEHDGRWWAIDPLGRGFYFTGIQSANVWGVQDFLTRRRFYHEHCLKTFGTQEKWEEDCLAKLKDWGFNMLGHGCQRSLEGRGLVHARELAMTQVLCRGEDPDRYICRETTPACSAFPNVFHPDFVRHCEVFARKNCAPFRDDPWVAGWYVDNELAWWGDREARYQPRCNGLYETVVRLPAGHSARQTLDRFLSDRGVRKGDSVPDGLKREFLLFAAERYFSVTAAAIRAADPNHMLLGARFAGVGGAADPEVFAIAARYSDVLTFNCYPWADLDANEVLVHAGGPRVTEAFDELYGRARKPFLITEWSFPALDAGLPCSGGAGQRFATQELRAQASELWMRTLLALPYVVGWNYFRWVDQPASGIARYNREDTNYGLVNERNEPYARLVEVFARVQKDVFRLRQAGLPPKRRPAADAQDPVRMLQGLKPPDKVLFRRSADAFTVDAGNGFVFTGRVGGAHLVDSIRIGDRRIGSYGAMMSLDRPDGRRVWIEAGRVSDVAWSDSPDGGGSLTLRAEAREGRIAFALTHRLDFRPGVSKFLCSCLKAENLGRDPLRIDRIYFRLLPAFSVSAPENRDTVAPMWKVPRQAAWTSRTGLLFGAMTQADDVAVFRFYTDERGRPHPDMGFYPNGPRVWAPGTVWTPRRPMWILATAAATCAVPPPPGPMFTPEQVTAIADEWDARDRETAKRRKEKMPASRP